MLASRSAMAAKEIKVLISNSGQKVNIGMQQVSVAGGNIGNIVAQAIRVSALIGKILTATGEQTRG